MQSVGFKEWAIICEALGRGEQSIIIRKGGIAEGRAGFSFQYREFFLFSTFFHEQAGRTRLPVETTIPAQTAGLIEIGQFARLEFSAVVTSWETALALEPFHLCKREVVRERFDYEDAPGIHVAVVRAYQLRPSWIFEDEPRFGGCRSWVNLPERPTNLEFLPALSDESHAQRIAELQAILASENAGVR